MVYLVEDLKRKFPCWDVDDYWIESAKRRCTCRLCGKVIEKGEERIAVIVELYTPGLLREMERGKTPWGHGRTLYFCTRHSVEEVLKALESPC